MSILSLRNYNHFAALPFGPQLRAQCGALIGVLLAQEEDDTVRVRRRRRGGPTEGQPRERAETPSRERDRPSGAGRPPSGGGSSGGTGGQGGGFRPSGGGTPGGGMGIIGIIIVIIVAVVFGGQNLFQGGTTEQPQPSNQQQAQINTPTAAPANAPASATATPRPAATATRQAAANAPAGGTGDTWTIMLYQDADDKILEHDIYLDLNEAERVGSTDSVHIVAQVDRYQGGYQGDGNWTHAKRLYVTQDDDLQTVNSQEVADLGEVNMASAETLVDFVTWAMAEYPADKYALIMSDHGMGWPGGWSDPTAARTAGSGTPLEARLGDQLFLNELDTALEQIRAETGLDKLELIGMDACLMAHIEVFAALEPHARFAVASQETEPALGWAYTSFLGGLIANPSMDGGELSQLILDSYIVEDQRVVDDQARAEFAGRGQPMGGLFDILFSQAAAPSAEQVASQLSQNITLSAVDLSAIPALMQNINLLADELQTLNQKSVAQARSYAQSFTSIFGKQVPPSYIDLRHFAQLFQQAGASGALGEAVDGVMAAVDQAVIAELHGPKLPGSTGISIYFPVAQLYRTAEAGPQSYTAISSRFSQQSAWDEFLLFHYTGRAFDIESRAAAVPDASATVRGPASGGIMVAPITASSATAAPGNPVLLSTRIEGENVGYVYFFTGFYDAAANSILTVDMDYLESEEAGELNGVYYPIWPEDGSFNMEFEWEPTFFAMTDGTNTATALFQPHTYGAAPEDAVYTVEGTYTYADDEESRPARLFFSDGILRQVFGFDGTSQFGAPREIIPQAGDTFTIQERWMDLDANGAVTEVVTEDGDTLTFGDQPFTWLEQDAAAGTYLVGFIVEDLDGNDTHAYTQITVE